MHSHFFLFIIVGSFASFPASIHSFTHSVFRSSVPVSFRIPALVGCNIPGLFFPMMCLVDYLGKRMVCVSHIQGIGDSTLVYGSADAGRTVHTARATLNSQIAGCCEQLNLAPHTVLPLQSRKSKSVLIFGPGDLEGHAVERRVPISSSSSSSSSSQEEGQKFEVRTSHYLLDFARLFPPEDTNISMSNSAKFHGLVFQNPGMEELRVRVSGAQPSADPSDEGGPGKHDRREPKILLSFNCSNWNRYLEVCHRSLFSPSSFSFVSLFLFLISHLLFIPFLSRRFWRSNGRRRGISSPSSRPSPRRSWQQRWSRMNPQEALMILRQPQRARRKRRSIVALWKCGASPPRKENFSSIRMPWEI